MQIEKPSASSENASVFRQTAMQSGWHSECWLRLKSWLFILSPRRQVRGGNSHQGRTAVCEGGEGERFLLAAVRITHLSCLDPEFRVDRGSTPKLDHSMEDLK